MDAKLHFMGKDLRSLSLLTPGRVADRQNEQEQYTGLHLVNSQLRFYENESGAVVMETNVSKRDGETGLPAILRIAVQSQFLVPACPLARH